MTLGAAGGAYSARAASELSYVEQGTGVTNLVLCTRRP